jgi:hypothetical protein
VEVEMESWPEAPPTKAPKVPEYERLRPSEGAEVATLDIVVGEVVVKYATPFADSEDVEIWKPGACLLLKVVQSVEDRQPFCPLVAVAQSIDSAPPMTERPAVTVIAVDPAETVPVATPNTPFVPFETRSWDEEGCEVVARPQ